MKKIKIFLIIIIVLIIGFGIWYKIYDKKYYESYFNELLSGANYGGNTVINSDKDTSKSEFCIGIRDITYNNAVGTKDNHYMVCVFEIQDNSELKLVSSKVWKNEEISSFFEKIDKLEKCYEENENRIKIINGMEEYYVKMIDLNPIMYQYFFINLNLPSRDILK